MELEADVSTSIECLAHLETVWVGAERSRAMLEELFKVSKRLRNQKRAYAEVETEFASQLQMSSNILLQDFDFGELSGGIGVS